eukprot:gnl/Chilomastix_cuspidata/1494.p1 GENE.gnl/Chilomastix_cuspidata/1494~~gnl/Chilomastix_cuspidata/1494.p1  ORF type:complete len:315 (-),score=52.00 gnl/Chilomastix_cuspidata/1494:839-1783(-)
MELPTLGHLVANPFVPDQLSFLSSSEQLQSLSYSDTLLAYSLTPRPYSSKSFQSAREKLENVFPPKSPVTPRAPAATQTPGPIPGYSSVSSGSQRATRRAQARRPSIIVIAPPSTRRQRAHHAKHVFAGVLAVAALVTFVALFYVIPFCLVTFTPSAFLVEAPGNGSLTPSELALVAKPSAAVAPWIFYVWSFELVVDFRLVLSDDAGQGTCDGSAGTCAVATAVLAPYERIKFAPLRADKEGFEVTVPIALQDEASCFDCHLSASGDRLALRFEVLSVSVRPWGLFSLGPGRLVAAVLSHLGHALPTVTLVVP